MSSLELRREGGIARIHLNRLKKANALDSALLDELRAALEDLKDDAALRVVVLGGNGNNFCAGADVNEMAALDPSTSRSFIRRIHHACRALRELPVPVIARLHGAVIGAGLELAAACDLRIAADNARFSMPEVRIGIPSVVEAALLPRLMGAGRAAWLVLTGETIDAARAYEWGFLERVVSVSRLDAELEKICAAIVSNEREALRAQKQLTQMWDELPLAASVQASIDLFAQAYASGTPNRLMKK